MFVAIGDFCDTYWKSPKNCHFFKYKKVKIFFTRIKIGFWSKITRNSPKIDNFWKSPDLKNKSPANFWKMSPRHPQISPVCRQIATSGNTAFTELQYISQKSMTIKWKIKCIDYVLYFCNQYITFKNTAMPINTTIKYVYLFRDILDMQST